MEGEVSRPAADSDTLPVNRAEIVNAVVIALSGLLIAFASYQADLWSGEEDANFTRANILYTQAARTWDRSNTHQGVAVELFSHWLDARLRGEPRLAAFYETRIPADYQPAFQAWLALDPLENPSAPASPLAMPQFAPKGPVQAKALEAQGDAAFRIGRHARRIGDSFSQAGTVLSTALFFAGISQVFRSLATRRALMILAALACILGVARLFTLPLMSLFGAGA